ncbi:MAG TPA: radical SAM family heme chaperone HemW, partial [Terriglobales bacterium]
TEGRRGARSRFFRKGALAPEVTTKLKLGIYISVPFCRTKCSFCNFASEVGKPATFAPYLSLVERELRGAEQLAASLGGQFTRAADSVYLGGGTPSVLTPEQLRSLFAAVCSGFDVEHNAEITVECAPGTLSDTMIETLVACGVNRVSLGLQSWIDQESRAVGRLHTAAIARAEIDRLRNAGITEINLDLIAGLPYQTEESWRESLRQTVDTGVPHVSVYMLEVDEDSRLGRELIAGGTRYHAHHVPDEELTADLYEMACAELNAAEVEQYEISNFARAGHQSRHNLKYWTRQPYLGFGVDAHSFLPHISAEENGANMGHHSAVRFATGDSLESLLTVNEGFAPRTRTIVDEQTAIEEAWFLGLRLNAGVDLLAMKEEYGIDAVDGYREEISQLVSDGLLELAGERIRLTARGRLLSNTVFAAFLCERPIIEEERAQTSTFRVLR